MVTHACSIFSTRLPQRRTPKSTMKPVMLSILLLPVGVEQTTSLFNQSSS